MISTILWISWLALRRDKVALLMTFVLPPLLFVAFAAIFSNAPGHDIKLKLVVADIARTATTQRLVEALDHASALRVIKLDRGTAADVEDLVSRGVGDAGLIITDDLAGKRGTPLVVVEAPDRPLAASMAIGQVQRVVGEALPDVLLVRILTDLEATKAIDADDRAFLDKAFAKQAGDRANAPFTFSKLAVIQPIARGAAGRNGGVLQYAAAVSAIFLLFGAMQGAYVLIDERENGLADRVRLASGGMPGALSGRLLFLAGQGFVQVASVYLTASLIYGASIPLALFPLWVAAAVLAAVACAGMALLACTLSRTRRQAELWTTFAVLLLSALGGSMVPRYLMPAWLQTASWWTPNAWIMNGLQQSILPGGGVSNIASTLAVLGSIAFVTFALALVAA